jgi:cyclopropane-fatty-acyl-phospholipid synthase
MAQMAMDAWAARSLHAPEFLRLQWSIVVQGIVLNLVLLTAPFTFTWDALLVTVVLWWLSAGLGISLGFHRLLSHGSFKTSRPFKYVLSILGILANQGPPLVWVGTHRLHHRQPDLPGDPHTPIRNFWWAQFFWVFLFPHAEARRAARDLARDRGLVVLDRCYFLPQFVLIVLLYTAGGLPWVVWGFFVRVGFTLTCTSFVNSVTHRWGYRNFDTSDLSRNSWWVALVTFGEGWHNNHHAAPRSAVHGLRWWEVDLTYQTVRALEALHLVWDVQRPAPAQAATRARARPTGKPPWRYLKLGLDKGALFATIQYFSDRDVVLDADTTWRFWTQPANPVFDFLARQWPTYGRRRALLKRMMSQTHAIGIEAHYDISNAFYRLWLDRDWMFYSCAKFDSPSDSLEQAQGNKAQLLLSLLEPRAGEKILDLGCGWGGMMKAIIQVTNDRHNLLGLSLARAQVDYVRNVLGLACAHANFISTDYAPGSCAKICTVGSLEHVRPHEIEMLHAKLYRALPRGGRVVHQFFSTDADPHSTYMVALQHFFPGTVLSRHSRIVGAIRRCGFRIAVDVTDDYRPTLRAWFNNLVANQEAALRLVGTHAYNKYLTFLPASWRFFADGQARLHRLLLVKD